MYSVTWIKDGDILSITTPAYKVAIEVFKTQPGARFWFINKNDARPARLIKL